MGLGVLNGAHLFVTGRIKDVIIVRGRKIAAAELEWLAAQADPALNPFAAAAFQSDAADSGTAVLLIEAKSSKDMPAPDRSEKLCAAIRRSVLGEWGIELEDVSILPRGTLPRTTSGKIRRRIIATEHMARRSLHPANRNTPDR